METVTLLLPKFLTFVCWSQEEALQRKSVSLLRIAILRQISFLANRQTNINREKRETTVCEKQENTPK